MTRVLIMHVIICMHVPELSTRVQFTVLCERMSFDVQKVVAVQSSVHHWLG